MTEFEQIDRKLNAIDALEAITPCSINWDIQNPRLLQEKMGRTFDMFQRVEQEVDADNLLALLPCLDEQKQRFLHTWNWQENYHGDDFAELLRRVGSEPNDYKTEEVPGLNRFAGKLGRVSAGIHEVFEMVYLSRGAMHERLTKHGYDRMAEQLVSLGEVALKESMVDRILEQEAHHLGYYRMAAKQLKQRLRPWQQAAVKRLSLATYAPVGSSAKRHKPTFGHTTLVLMSGEPTVDECAALEAEGRSLDDLPDYRLRRFTRPIQKIGQQLLALGDDDILPDFVHKAVAECIEAEEERLVSLAA